MVPRSPPPPVQGLRSSTYVDATIRREQDARFRVPKRLLQQQSREYTGLCRWNTRFPPWAWEGMGSRKDLRGIVLRAYVRSSYLSVLAVESCSFLGVSEACELLTLCLSVSAVDIFLCAKVGVPGSREWLPLRHVDMVAQTAPLTRLLVRRGHADRRRSWCTQLFHGLPTKLHCSYSPAVRGSRLLYPMNPSPPHLFSSLSCWRAGNDW